MKNPLTRRDFLTDSGRKVGGAAVGVAGLNLGVHTIVRAEEKPTPKDILTLGLIGCGGMGWNNLRDFMRTPEVRVAAICDPDRTRIEDVQKKIDGERSKQQQEVEKYTTHKDFRELLDKKHMDCVIIATPDHWHALPLIYACQASKDVYCEKPISHNVVEGRAMVNAVKRYKRVCQIGTQQRSGEHFQRAIELVQNGALGKVCLTRTWNHSNEGPNGIGNPPDSEPPNYLDHELWLGPAPKRPYNPNRSHVQWRWFFDYGSGMVGDWNVHLQDIVHLAMKTGRPKNVSASGGRFALQDNRDTPDLMEATYEFEGPDGPFIQVYTMRKFNSNRLADKYHQHGIQFVGTDGTLTLDRGGFEIVPETEKESDHERNRTEPVKSGGSDQHWPHVQNFLACVKSREKPRSDIESMHETTLCCHLANISMRVSRKIYWDPLKEQCYRDPEHKIPDTEANALLGREYRKPWSLPKIEVA